MLGQARLVNVGHGVGRAARSACTACTAAGCPSTPDQCGCSNKGAQNGIAFSRLVCIILINIFTKEYRPHTKVFVVPHSHEDPGWTQTIEQYFNGYDATHYGVKRIYDSVLEALSPTAAQHRRFIAVCGEDAQRQGDGPVGVPRRYLATNQPTVDIGCACRPRP